MYKTSTMEIGTVASLLNFRSLYNSAPCGLLTFEINGPIVYVNETLLKWLSVEEIEIVNKSFTDILDRAGVIYYELFVRPILKMHQEVKEISFNIQTANGTFSCLFNGVAISGGEIINATIFKVEDRKKYENELLFKRTRAEEEKQSKSKALQEISFDQSHLVRAPLANILGLASLLEPMVQQDEEVKQIITMLQASASELDKQIRAIVDKANINT